MKVLVAGFAAKNRKITLKWIMLYWREMFKLSSQMCVNQHRANTHGLNALKEVNRFKRTKCLKLLLFWEEWFWRRRVTTAGIKLSRWCEHDICYDQSCVCVYSQWKCIGKFLNNILQTWKTVLEIQSKKCISGFKTCSSKEVIKKQTLRFQLHQNRFKPDLPSGQPAWIIYWPKRID